MGCRLLNVRFPPFVHQGPSVVFPGVSAGSMNFNPKAHPNKKVDGLIFFQALCIVASTEIKKINFVIPRETNGRVTFERAEN